MPRKRRESEIRDGEITIRDRKPSVSRPRCFGWMASRLLAVADSRSWELGRGPTGDRGGGVSNSRQAIRNHGRDRRQPSRLECSDGRWASVVGPKPPKGNYRWGPKILGGRCGRATCAGPKLGLLVKDEGLEELITHYNVLVAKKPATTFIMFMAISINSTK